LGESALNTNGLLSRFLSLNVKTHHNVVDGFIGWKTPAILYLRICNNIFFSIVICLFLISGCTAPFKDIIKEKPAQPETSGRVKISEDYAVVLASPSDTYELLAKKYYGNQGLAYVIAEFNKNQSIEPDREIVIPLKPVNPGGLYPDGYQTVTILCYHQFSKKKTNSKISISEEVFDQQMEYLKKNGYNVISLDTFYDFIGYKRRPPKNSVVITIDDGWKTMKTIAAPILKKYGFRATLFIYTDLIKSKPSNATLCWDDIKEMIDDGVVEVQSHTVSHADLTKLMDESLESELEESQRIIKEKLGINVTSLAYPYGAFNNQVIDKLKKYGYKDAFTVIKGSNAFFHNNFALNRSMVFNSEDIEDFTKLLETYKRD
jgi:peptidoglycan/xylan/chitin deacetylase (PgdA/CDA1 family)